MPKRCAAAVEQQPLPPAVPVSLPSEVADFTPECVVDGRRCIARTWGGGLGGQCKSLAVSGSRHCRAHLKASAHGDVTGEIPPPKLKDFVRAARARRASSA